MDIVPLYKPFMPDDLGELNQIIYSGALSYGKWGRLFESNLANYIGENKILTANSYNSAMLIALETIGIKPGDEVIASPMSCLASNQPFVTVGAKVVWADIDPATGTLDPESVKEKISKKTKAIFHNHFCGYVGYIDEINNIGEKYGIIVADDAIEAFGSIYKGKKMGNVKTDLTVFSFQTVRLPNTIDGGAICFRDEELYQKALLIRDQGINRKIFRDDLGEISVKCDITLPGFGATMNEISSYIGSRQMDVIDSLLAKQKANGFKWEDKLSGLIQNYHLLKTSLERSPNYWIMGLLTNEKRNTIKYFRSIGYYASGVHLPNNYYSVFESRIKLPGVEEFYSKFVALPSGWWFDL